MPIERSKSTALKKSKVPGLTSFKLLARSKSKLTKTRIYKDKHSKSSDSCESQNRCIDTDYGQVMDESVRINNTFNDQIKLSDITKESSDADSTETGHEIKNDSCKQPQATDLPSSSLVGGLLVSKDHLPLELKSNVRIKSVPSTDSELPITSTLSPRLYLGDTRRPINEANYRLYPANYQPFHNVQYESNHVFPSHPTLPISVGTEIYEHGGVTRNASLQAGPSRYISSDQTFDGNPHNMSLGHAGQIMPSIVPSNREAIPIQLSSSTPASKLTTVHWQDENIICYQVEANGIAVLRRADNGMVNGTKMLNVTKMTRGKRDGILRGEKGRKVVKYGSIHFKGVWIPLDRAHAIAVKERIDHLLYPLFVNDIQSFSCSNTRGRQTFAYNFPSNNYFPENRGLINLNNQWTHSNILPNNRISLMPSSGYLPHYFALDYSTPGLNSMIGSHQYCPNNGHTPVNANVNLNIANWSRPALYALPKLSVLFDRNHPSLQADNQNMVYQKRNGCL